MSRPKGNLGGNCKIKTEAIRKIMYENGLTSTDVAVLCNISPNTLRHILARGTAKFKIAERIAEGLGVETRNIVVFPRKKYEDYLKNKKTAEAATPAACKDRPHTSDFDFNIADAICQNEDKYILFDGAWRTEDRLMSLISMMTIDDIVELFNLPVIVITRVR